METAAKAVWMRVRFPKSIVGRCHLKMGEKVWVDLVNEVLWQPYETVRNGARYLSINAHERLMAGQM